MKRAESALAYDDNLNSFAKATHIRLLFHWFGDLHQPLHNVAFFNSTMINGDRGGNLFSVNTKNILRSGYDMRGLD